MALLKLGTDINNIRVLLVTKPPSLTNMLIAADTSFTLLLRNTVESRRTKDSRPQHFAPGRADERTKRVLFVRKFA